MADTDIQRVWPSHSQQTHAEHCITAIGLADYVGRLTEFKDSSSKVAGMSTK